MLCLEFKGEVSYNVRGSESNGGWLCDLSDVRVEINEKVNP